MLTMKKLDKKLKELENKIPKEIKNCEFIIRKNLFKPKYNGIESIEQQTKKYEEEKRDLINRNFHYKKTETLSWSILNDEYEIWEKKYGQGDF